MDQNPVYARTTCRNCGNLFSDHQLAYYTDDILALCNNCGQRPNLSGEASDEDWDDTVVTSTPIVTTPWIRDGTLPGDDESTCEAIDYSEADAPVAHPFNFFTPEDRLISSESEDDFGETGEIVCTPRMQSLPPVSPQTRRNCLVRQSMARELANVIFPEYLHYFSDEDEEEEEREALLAEAETYYTEQLDTDNGQVVRMVYQTRRYR
jgi:predicted  nucleic acid-binding Zn-ribbon protein